MRKKVPHMNTLIDIHATHSEIESLLLSQHVNTPAVSGVAYYLRQS